MAEEIQKHPSEEDLLEFAMGRENEAISGHVETCQTCRSFIREMKSVKDSLSAIDEEDMPPMGRKIALSGKLTRIPSFFDDLRLNWFRNPLVLTIGYILYILLIAFAFLYLNGLDGELPR